MEFYIFKVGTYKSAVEPYMTDKFSDANREQLTSFLGSIWGNMTSAICASRNIASADLDTFLNQGLAFDDAQVMVDYKLVDALAYRKEAEDCVKRMAGQSLDDKMVSADVKKMLAIPEKTQESSNKIAVLYAEGEIREKSNSAMGMDEAVISEDMATTFFGIYMLAFLLGRWIGTFLMGYFRPQNMLLVYALVNIVLCGVITVYGGLVGVYAMIAISFFMSIMYPTQFSLAVTDLGRETKSGSAFLVMAIVGNACLPQLTAFVMSHYPTMYQVSYLIPLVCFVFCAYYGWKGYRIID